MYDNKKILVFGMARSGYEVAKVLIQHHCQVLVVDAIEQDPDHVQELEALGINIKISKEAEDFLDDSFAYVVKNPGIIPDHPLCIKAKELGIPVINEVEVAYHYLPEHVKIIGITGSNGKTTTTTLTYEILKAAHLPVHLGGNIGYPFCSLLSKVKANDIIVLEISAQQLHDFKDFTTDIGILTNLTPVHLDAFKTYENYQKQKLKLFDHHTSNHIAILNGSDSDVLSLTNKIASSKIYFSSKEKKDIYIQEDAIYYHKDKIVELQHIGLKGDHNYENIMCAIAVSKQFDVDNETIQTVLQNFHGVEHRLEFVKEVKGRKFYNDSKATNVKSTQIALAAFSQSTILLLGGLDRGHSFDELQSYLENTKQIVCYGETKHRIEEFAHKIGKPCIVLNTLEEATKKAYELSADGDIILLSPACASWDQYAKFEDRGDDFKRVVQSL